MLFSFFLLFNPHGRRYVYEMIRCCSNFIRRWSNDVHVDPYSHVKHWRRRTARVKTAAPIIFYVHPGASSDAPPRYTSRHCPFLQRRRASSAAEKALFSFLLFSSGPETTIFLLTRHSATLPMTARGGACVIEAPRRQCVLHFIFIQQ